MRNRFRIPLILAATAALFVAGLALAQVSGEPTVATQTFTHEDVVTYTIPTETVTTVETVTETVTVTTETEPPPTTTTEPPPSQPDIIITPTSSPIRWQCTEPQDRGLVRVTIDAPDTDAVQLRAGCTGRIRHLEITGRFGDCIKANPPDGGPRNLVVENGFCRSTGTSAVHQDCIQGGGGENITFRNFVFDCNNGGGGQFFIAGFNGGTPHNYICDHCALGPRHPNQVRTPSDPDSGVMNSLVCESESGRTTYSPASGDKGGNIVPPASDPRCTFEGLLAYVGG